MSYRFAEFFIFVFAVLADSDKGEVLYIFL